MFIIIFAAAAAIATTSAAAEKAIISFKNRNINKQKLALLITTKLPNLKFISETLNNNMKSKFDRILN